MNERLEAALDYRGLLGWGEVPAELEQQATAADFVAAAVAIRGIVESKSLRPGDIELRHLWQNNRSNSEALVRLFGGPLLRQVITARRRAEGEAARAARLAEGFEVEVRLDLATLRGLGERQFLCGDPEDRGVLSAAVLRAVEFVTGPPPAGFERP
jgi:hypothetical protein